MVQLPGRRTTTLDVPLESAIGFLTIRPPKPHARVSIAGVGDYSEKVEDLALPPGTYRVTVTAPMHETLTLEVPVVAGQTASPDIRMSLIKAAWPNSTRT